MSAALVRYDAARTALEEAARVDDVKEIRDRAVALQCYARQAKDGTLIANATMLRLRAERKAGALLKEMAETGERDSGNGGDRKSRLQAETVKLADLGVTKTQSHRWQKLAALDAEEFEWRAAARAHEAEQSLVASRAEKQAEKRERRDDRERELAQKQRALPQKRYGVIYADIEARFEVFSRESGMDRAPENHYPTTDFETLKARDVAAIAADDCVLFFWAWAPNLPQCLDVMAAWGFAYKSHVVWVKDRVGTGYWFRAQHELLLVGVKGAPPAPAMGAQAASVFHAPRGRHSEKPECALEMIEAYYPNLPKIELNRRGPPRPGWDAWGNEAGESK